MPKIKPRSSVANYLEDALPPITSAGGAMVGAAIPGADLTGVPEVAGAGIGWNVGQELENTLQGKGDPRNLLTMNNAINTGLSMVGQGFSKLGTSAITKEAGNIAKSKATEPLGQFKTTPSTITNFAANHGSGTGLMDYINKFKGMFPSWDGSAETFNQEVKDPINEKYTNSLQGVPLNRSDVEAGYNSRIATLQRLNPTNPNSPSIQALQNERDNVMEYLDQAHNPKGAFTPYAKNEGRPTTYDAQAVNVYKGLKDKATPSSQFNLSPEESKNLQRTSGDILRQAVYKAGDDASGQTGQLKNLGIDAKASYGLGKIADDTNALTQAGRFQPGNQGGLNGSIKGGLLRTSLEAGAGALLSSHFGLSPLIGGAMAPAITEGLLSAREPIISGASAALSSPVGQFGANLAGQSLPVTSSKFIGNNPNNNISNKTYHAGDYSTNPGQSPADVVNDPARDSKTGNWKAPTDLKTLTIPGDDPTWTQDRYLQEAGNLVNNPPSAAQLDKKWKQIYDNRQNWIGSHTPSGMTDFVSNYPTELNQTNALRDIIKKYGGVTGPQNFSDLVKYAEAQKDPQAAVGFGMMANNQAAQTHQTLGRVTQFDINYLQNFPQPTDTSDTALAKLDRFSKTQSDNYRTYKPIYDYSLANGTSAQPSVTPPPSATMTSPLPKITPGASQSSTNQALPPMPSNFQSLSGL